MIFFYNSAITRNLDDHFDKLIIVPVASCISLGTTCVDTSVFAVCNMRVKYGMIKMIINYSIFKWIKITSSFLLN